MKKNDRISQEIAKYCTDHNLKLQEVSYMLSENKQNIRIFKIGCTISEYYQTMRCRYIG